MPWIPIDCASVVEACTPRQVLLAGEHPVDGVPGQACLVRQPAQHVVVADVLALGPVGVHQPVVDLLVQAAVAGELRDPERVTAVRDHLRRRRVGEAAGRELRLQPVVESPAVARLEVGPRDAFARVLGVQVERQERDGGAEPAREPPGRPLAEAAERSDVSRTRRGRGGRSRFLQREHVVDRLAAADHPRLARRRRAPRPAAGRRCSSTPSRACSAPVAGTASTSPRRGSGSSTRSISTSPDSQCLPATAYGAVGLASARSATSAV